jgi:hypothetical protein
MYIDKKARNAPTAADTLVLYTDLSLRNVIRVVDDNNRRGFLADKKTALDNRISEWKESHEEGVRKNGVYGPGRSVMSCTEVQEEKEALVKGMTVAIETWVADEQTAREKQSCGQQDGEDEPAS